MDLLIMSFSRPPGGFFSGVVLLTFTAVTGWMTASSSRRVAVKGLRKGQEDNRQAA